MEKLVYLLFRTRDLPGAALRDELVQKTAASLRAAGATQIAVNVDDEAVAAGRPIRRSEPPIRAMVSFWLENSDDREEAERVLGERTTRLAGYLVSESRPIVHERPLGQRTPGMNQVTCISRKRGLAVQEFFHIWNVDHKRVAIETQSTFGYVRNVIVRPLCGESPAWDAIVEESFPIEALDDLRVFYAADSDEALEANMQRMMESCQRFLDFEPLECTPMSEYYLG